MCLTLFSWYTQPKLESMGHGEMFEADGFQLIINWPICQSPVVIKLEIHSRVWVKPLGQHYLRNGRFYRLQYCVCINNFVSWGVYLDSCRKLRTKTKQKCLKEEVKDRLTLHGPHTKLTRTLHRFTKLDIFTSGNITCDVHSILMHEHHHTY